MRLDSRPFTFERHQYQRAIYDDTVRRVVLIKAAQIGGTTWAILRSVHACLQGLNVVYFFPTRTDVMDFSKSRVRALIEENPFLAREIRDTDTAGLKRIGPAHLYLRGMKSTVAVKSVPADMVVFDELDEATPEAKTMALERLAHSGYKRVVELSNPSLPGYGIDEAFESTDQRHWTLKCPACGHWTCLDREFPRELGQDIRVLQIDAEEQVYRACVKCSKPLDLEVGEWVADFPERPDHGYLLSQLHSPFVDAADILRDYRTTRYPERFYNLKIGIAWVDRQHRLHAEEVLALCGEEPMHTESRTSCVMGVDTGRELHVVIAELAYREDPVPVRYVGVAHAFEELDELMTRFSVRRCVVDALPETHAARAFAARHPGRVYLNFFNEHQRGETKWDEEQPLVSENRTEALDASRRAIREKDVVLPRACPAVRTFAAHMANDAKQLEEDPDTGSQRYRYVRTGPDHYSLAFTYLWLAAEALRRWKPDYEAVQIVPLRSISECDYDPIIHAPRVY